MRRQNAEGLHRRDRLWSRDIHCPGELVLPVLGVAIAQKTDATDASGEIKDLRRLLEAVDLEGDRASGSAGSAARGR